MRRGLHPVSGMLEYRGVPVLPVGHMTRLVIVNSAPVPALSPHPRPERCKIGEICPLDPVCYRIACHCVLPFGSVVRCAVRPLAVRCDAVVHCEDGASVLQGGIVVDWVALWLIVTVWKGHFVQTCANVVQFASLESDGVCRSIAYGIA